VSETQREPGWLEILRRASRQSRHSLSLIGESDWTPQDGAHSALLQAVESALAAISAETMEGRF
jgi:hypothetical protein